MDQHNIIRRVAAGAIATATSLVAVTACGAPSSSGSIAHAEQVAASCPTDGGQIAARVDSDESGTSRGETTNPARQQVIREVAERTVICGGHLRVTVFDGSMIGVTVFDGDLHLDGATANARLRKAPKAVDAVMEQINTALPAATSQLSGGATDIVGQYQHGAEYEAQLAATGAFHLEQTILTDGIQTAEADLSDPALTADQAQALAATFLVPDLSGATVRLVGIGRQADEAPLPTPYIAALRAFHTAVCEKTGATCTVVTDAAGA
ncbi:MULTISPECIES: hypothetical protein [Mycobacteroides]|uniref:hypothetical protein n=1 Tax=Mycobacteroides TaxID=670516 RepID=UPI0009294348|nr:MULTISPECIES: hypothetical protein [Mycobacteroides]MBF9435240.1 hypothetical protein [Mycobacteroides chelonae]MBN7504586.1 hypothetical protein [Mycobacteroides abscessus subsp. massiliense]MDO3037416.1 hypothetical protein [Mycobacteroides abscessus subsp. abscessus]MDO3111323.1 hypothetical protein [Mycobacteroides abscessus subsp. massiliense]MDO3260472.1 hypothetical protein [Mycobacteroides abscessus subsp. abscessus]